MNGSSVATQARPDNKLAVKHGAFSPELIAARLPEVVAALHEAISAAVPYLQPIDSLLVEQTARTTVRLRLIDEWLDDLGGSWIDSRGRPRRCWQLYNSLQGQQRALLATLGVGPVARAQFIGGLAQAQQVANSQAAQERLREQAAGA